MSDNNDTAYADAPAKKSPEFIGLIKVVALVTVIVIVEVVAASLFVPSRKETEELAKQLAAATKGETAGDFGEEHQWQRDDEIEEDTVEILIGTYHVTHFRPESETTITIDIEVHGSVLAVEKHEFSESFEKNKGRVGEQIILTLHSAETADLTDAGLGLIKRKILEKTNRALGKPLIREVLFSMFNFVER